MGAWHTGVYDNDIALDFMGKVAEHVSLEMNATSNEEILVVADMLAKYSHPTPIDTACFVQTIKEELSYLDNWKEDCREERKQVLLDLLQNATKPYINEKDNTIIYPVSMTEEGDFIVQLFSKDNDVKEIELSIDYAMSNYVPMICDDFEITIDGINNNELQERIF